jgi:hypothetical protein
VEVGLSNVWNRASNNLPVLFLRGDYFPPDEKTEQHRVGAGNDTKFSPSHLGETVMYAVVRDYSGKGASALFDILEERKAEVESTMRAVEGFVSYTCARNDAGGFTVTVCQDSAGTAQSLRLAKEWVAKNAANTGVDAPKVSEGSVLIQAS